VHGDHPGGRPAALVALLDRPQTRNGNIMTVASSTDTTASAVTGSRRSIVTRSVRSAKRQWLWGYPLLFVVLLYLPSVFIMIFSFNSGIHIAFPLKEWTTSWYVQLSQDDAIL